MPSRSGQTWRRLEAIAAAIEAAAAREPYPRLAQLLQAREAQAARWRAAHA